MPPSVNGLHGAGVSDDVLCSPPFRCRDDTTRARPPPDIRSESDATLMISDRTCSRHVALNSGAIPSVTCGTTEKRVLAHFA
jgi:hypothetical protein